ncbi:hypothetical protein [uncultured Draconibacterium sp.]|uniref:hypothetical protein n=1 Tax=uncultured Draconibacterium sp. TaxID=1573823 RepID=UPI002AA8C5F7|nr:hypothetical protein [uncultured Draconibacterium sp.]
MEKLQDSLLILNKIAGEMMLRTLSILKAEAFDAHRINEFGIDLVILQSLLDRNIIDACSYLEEYEKYFGVKTELCYEEKIKQIKRINKPFIKRIKKWNNLQSVRNSFIAHNLRTNKHEMVFKGKLEFNAPRNPYETELLNHCIQFVHAIVVKEFQAELEQAKSNIKFEVNQFNAMSHEECWEEMEKLVTKVNSIIKEEGKAYSIKIP